MQRYAYYKMGQSSALESGISRGKMVVCNSLLDAAWVVLTSGRNKHEFTFFLLNLIPEECG